MKKRKLNAYLVTFSYCRYATETKEGQGQGTIRNVVMVERNEEEAVKRLFFHIQTNLNCDEENLKLIAVQLVRKTKKNARFYTEEYYERQNQVIDDYDGFMKRKYKHAEEE